MKLAPRIIQAMEILQLPVMALQERIEAELIANPVLEMREPGSDEDAQTVQDEGPGDRGEEPLVVNEDDGNSEDFERLADFQSEYENDLFDNDLPPRKPADPEAGDRKLEAMANTPAPDGSLSDHLLEQWTFVDADEEIITAGKAIIEYLDEDGYLRIPLEELVERTGGEVSVEALHHALPMIQQLDPLGVGARDLAECLRIQLAAEADAGRDVALELELVNRHLRDIEMNRLPQIARRTNKTIEQIKGAIENISHLNPRPGLLIGQRAVPGITPDVVVDIDDNGELIVYIPDADMPQLYISQDYQNLARNRTTEKGARKFLQRNIRSAQWLIEAIEQRRHTVRRVVWEVFQVQREFLDRGPEALRPLPMTDVAEKVGVHVATVSRAVAGKYVQAPRGIFPLRMFFSGGTTTSEGEEVAWDAVKAKLREIVDGEDKSKPFSDDKLADALKAEGIDIARRTVAKYRGLMDIPPARKRKQY